MICPHCKHDFSPGATVCPHCGSELNPSPWVIIRKVSPPDDMIIESLLRSFKIPVHLVKESIGSVYGLSVGPLGEVKVAVPELYAEEAIRLLEAHTEDT
jgi:hypothetical protein